MPIPGRASGNINASARSAGSAAGGGSLSLPVLGTPPAGRGGGGTAPKIRKSRNAPRRAAVLILVHIIIIIHVGLWLVTGMRTVTPVEPSEAMYTLEQGLVNAGFIFFVLALLATLIFGRVFCGWACHVVALQDLCAWMMKRLGVHPKPFRSRLLIYIPLGLALYMFVWPTFQREILQPLAGDQWAHAAPYLGYYPARPEFRAELTTTDFWATFPPWYIAVPFLLVCGFGAVYFLGSKGFCTYGCPYGGFFAPLDRIAPGRIVVSDACEGCGHCTAVCSSNVRIHEEVRQFGMVVDSGCMKCMDCVSVCPNEALSFGFAVPPALQWRNGHVVGETRAGAGKSRARTPWLRRKRAGSAITKRRYDLSWPEEVGAATVFLVLLAAYRGMFNSIPLLMAVGMAGIGTFLVWKLWSMWRTPNVRVQNLQLRYKGRLRSAGWAMGALASLVLVSGAWGAAVKYNLYFGDVHDARVTAAMDVVFAPEYTPDPEQRERALRAAQHLQRAGPPSQGGMGWMWSGERRSRLAWLLAVAGDDQAAAHHLRALIRGSTTPAPDLVDALVILTARQGGGYDEIAAELADILAAHPASGEIRLRLAALGLSAGRPDEAARQARLAATHQAEDPRVLLAAAEILIGAGEGAAAAELLHAALELSTHAGDAAQAHAQLAIGLVLQGRHEEAIAELVQAYELEPDNPRHARMIAQILNALGREAEATTWLRRANERSSAPAPGDPDAGR